MTRYKILGIEREGGREKERDTKTRYQVGGGERKIERISS